MAAADLYWLPLGAGGHFVRLNGRVYEALTSRLDRRPTCDLYHSALQVDVPEGRFVIEQTPVPDLSGKQRGVVAGGPQLLTADERLARRVLDLVPEVPTPVWGRDELGTGETWNSNSVISWVIARSGIDAESLRPPAGGRAPGWRAGLVVARRTG
jgi:hypothetical protein